MGTEVWQSGMEKVIGESSEGFEGDGLALTLSPPSITLEAPIVLHHRQPPALYAAPSAAGPSGATCRSSFRSRRGPSQGPHAGKSDTVKPPFLWATNRCATSFPITKLCNRGIRSIEGDVQCRRCERQEVVSYNLVAKFLEVAQFVKERKPLMHDRAPAKWMSPAFPNCPACGGAGSVRPVLAEKKRAINWLFMFLSQTLGCCNLKQLKYFYKHTKNHRTGAKDRVLYLTYITICNQLEPMGNF